MLFERPFRRKRIENEEHLRTAVVYIHNNPVHHGFCKHPGISLEQLPQLPVRQADAYRQGESHRVVWEDRRVYFAAYQPYQYQPDSSAGLSGYPSSDGNSISDNNNNNLTGPADLSGYPSSDGESISDSNNNNNLTGPADLSGYPLSDGDSISDNNNNT